MMVFQRLLRGISLATLSLLAWWMPVSGEPYPLSYEAIVKAEEHLEQAALESPQRHKYDTIQRDVHDIVFLLEQSWKAVEKSDDAARKDYARRALTLLERSAARGYFDLTKAEPVLVLIRHLLAERFG